MDFLKDMWNDLSKKTKYIIIGVVVIIALLIIL